MDGAGKIVSANAGPRPQLIGRLLSNGFLLSSNVEFSPSGCLFLLGSLALAGLFLLLATRIALKLLHCGLSINFTSVT